MSDEEIAADLRNIQELERKSPILSDLKTDFYKDLTAYLKMLEQRCISETSDQKKTLLNEEIVNTKKISLNIYELREKKIVLTAVTKARGGSPDLHNMVDIEKDLFDSVLKTVSESRTRILKGENKTVENEEKAERNKTEDLEKNPDLNPVVMVNEDIPEFVGTDSNKYCLRKYDVISMPKDMQNMLSKRDAVKKIKIDEIAS